jgi:cytochrome c
VRQEKSWISRSETEGLGVLARPTLCHRSLRKHNDDQHFAGQQSDFRCLGGRCVGARSNGRCEAAFKKCQVCHDIGEGARNKLGPALNGLDSRKAGTVEGYDYSEANKNSGIVWSEASFKEYIVDSAGKIPGTKMMFYDKNEKEIADLWSYLKQFGTDGKKK